jgi:hypothetical protein
LDIPIGIPVVEIPASTNGGDGVHITRTERNRRAERVAKTVHRTTLSLRVAVIGTLIDRYTITGLCLFVAGVAGYVVGIYVTYPGRAFSIAVVMIGIALAAVAQRSANGEHE